MTNTVKDVLDVWNEMINNPDIVCDKWSDTSSVEYIHQLKIYSIDVGDLPKNEAEEFIKKSIEKSIEKTPPKRKLLF